MPGLALKFSISFKSFLLSHVRKIQCYLTPFNFSKRFKNHQGCMQNEKAAFILASASAFHESTMFQTSTLASWVNQLQIYFISFLIKVRKAEDTHRL